MQPPLQIYPMVWEPDSEYRFVSSVSLPMDANSSSNYSLSSFQALNIHQTSFHVL